MSGPRSGLSAQLLIFLGSNTISSVGTWIHNVAASIYIFNATGSSLAVGAVATAQFASTVLLAPWAGTAADRVDLRRLLSGMQMGGAGAALLLAFASAAGFLTPLVLLVGSTVIGAFLGFCLPASQSLVPLLVAESRVAFAVALNSVTYNLARAVGPALAAIVLTAGGMTFAMLINAASFALFAVGVRSVHPLRARSASSAPLRSSFREAMVVVIGNPNLRILLLTVAVVAIAADPVTTLAPGLVVVSLDLEPGAVGWIMSLFGVGAVLSALATAGVAAKGRQYLAMALLVEVAGVLSIAFAPGPIFMAAGMTLAGVGFIQSISTATAMLHAFVPADVAGRVMAAWGIAFLGTRPIASILSGLLADATSPRLAAALMPLPALYVAGVLKRRRGLFA